jgi:hypothetical protein
MAGAAAIYLAAAWMVAPGFYDGIAPPQPYNFVCPPSIAGAQGGTPLSGHLVIKVINGVSDADAAYTDDGQVTIGFLPGAFDVTGKTAVNVDITPVSPCPNPPGLHFSTNTYRVTADAPMIKSATLVMQYSNLVVDPSFVYQADSPSGPWTKIVPSSQAQIWTVDTKVEKLGYFAAGYPSNSLATSSGGAGTQVLPIAVAILILVVLVGGVPLTILRRRQGRAGGDDDDEDEG